MWILVFIVSLLIVQFYGITELNVGANSEDGDWAMFHHDSAHTSYSTGTAPANSTVKWTFSTSDNIINSSPAIVDGLLYVGSDNGNIYCIDADTGKQIWVNFTITKPVYSSPAVMDSYVYFGCEDGKVYCLDAQTGNEVWNYQTGREIGRSSPTVTHGSVYIGSGDGNLYCLNALTGDKKWNFTTVGEYDPHTTIGPWTSATSSPAVVNGYIFVGGTSFYCLNADSGSLVWSYPTVVSCSPAVSDDKVYFCSYNNTAYCLNKKTGTFIWSRPDIGPQFAAGEFSPAVAYDNVFFGGSGVICLNASTGTQVWNFSNSGIFLRSSPAIAGGYLYFGS
jgi:eukaryotic-like serine/threonine-protein kinase